MAARDAFLQALEDGDSRRLKRIWSSQFPDLPAPKDAAEAETTMHLARTASERVTFRKRAYSHAWLVERNLPSQLPNDLRPAAQREYPQVAAAVGIAVKSEKDWLRPAVPHLVGAMAKVVQDNQELIVGDPDLLRDKIHFARKDEFRRLFAADRASEVDGSK